MIVTFCTNYPMTIRIPPHALEHRQARRPQGATCGPGRAKADRTASPPAPPSRRPGRCGRRPPWSRASLCRSTRRPTRVPATPWPGQGAARGCQAPGGTLPCARGSRTPRSPRRLARPAAAGASPRRRCRESHSPAGRSTRPPLTGKSPDTAYPYPYPKGRPARTLARNPRQALPRPRTRRPRSTRYSGSTRCGRRPTGPGIRPRRGTDPPTPCGHRPCGR